MMTHKDRIEAYLSASVGKETMWRFEDALRDDVNLLEQFIASCEQAVSAAPAGFVGLVMQGIEQLSLPSAPQVPVLSRKMCAAVCFCSAAAIAFFTITGFEWHIFDILSNHTDKLSQFMNTFISR